MRLGIVCYFIFIACLYVSYHLLLDFVNYFVDDSRHVVDYYYRKLCKKMSMAKVFVQRVASTSAKTFSID